MSMLVCFLVCMMHVFVLPVCMYTMCACVCVSVHIHMHLCIFFTENMMCILRGDVIFTTLNNVDIFTTLYSAL